jgi:starch phosphorylase
MMRILMDQEGLPQETAWDITRQVFAYTNHTIMPEALEKWPVWMLEQLLPRHLQIIYAINDLHLAEVSARFPGDIQRLTRMSLVEEDGQKLVRMAHLAIAGSHSVNGVSKIHTEILKNELFRDFYELYPERFNNKTNGITQRRWLKNANPLLATLISDHIGDGWVRDLGELKRIIPLAEDPSFMAAWEEVKRENKRQLARYIQRYNCLEVDPLSLFDCQVKRIHEYKRQLLNILHVITLYLRLKDDPNYPMVPRTFIFSGKAAPSYTMAKLIIHLINSVADVVNADPVARGKLAVVFLANYGVSLAERILPAADLSEQISTAGTEASGTGNMKFALNGALTIGTLDGANIEIMEEVGRSNIFIFGLNEEEVIDLRRRGYNPADYVNGQPELARALNAIAGGLFSPGEPGLFQPIVDSLLSQGDHYLVCTDFAPYLACQQEVSTAFGDRQRWNRMSIANTANMGKFSSDRTIADYAREIWGIGSVDVSPLTEYRQKEPRG